MPERPRILIVDGNPVDRQTVVRALRREATELDGIDADIQEADSVAQAREVLRREEFTCIFLDHNLPDGTSLDLLMELRSQGLSTPVIVLTGERDEQMFVEVMQAGALDYLPKERLHSDLVVRSLRAALRFFQAQREKEAALEELRARDRAIAAASNGIVIADPRLPDCPIVYTNEAFLDMTGYTAEEVVGRNCRFLQGPDTNPESIRKLREAIAAEQPCQVSILNYRKDGAAFWNEVTVSPVRDPHGALTHFVGIQTDVTDRQEADLERRRMEDALRRSREDLRLAIDAARLGTFYCDYPLDKIIWNDTCKDHFFLPHDADVNFDVFYSLLHPDDREPTQIAIEWAMLEHVSYDVEYRTLARDGRTRWINAVGRFYYDLDGNPTRFDGVTQDISARKQAQEALRASEEALRIREAELRDTQARLQDALTAGRTGTWVWDVVNDYVVADQEFARLFSVSPEDAAGGPVSVYLQAIHPEDRDRIIQAITDVITHGDFFEEEYRVVLPDGSHRWLVTRARVERDDASRPLRFPGVVVDVTEQTEQRLRERFLEDLAERARRMSDPAEVISDMVQSVGQFFGASRCLFADIDPDADICVVHPDYCADPSVASMSGAFPISAFGPYLVGEYRAGRTVVVEDVHADLHRFPSEYAQSYDAVAVRSFIAVPVLHSARLVSVLAIHSTFPRRWKAEDVALAQTVTERIWLVVQVQRQQRALVREAEEQRLAHESTARILESITDAFMTFDADWRFTYLNDQGERILQRSREDLLGHVLWDEFPEAVGTTFEREYRRAVDEQTRVAFEAFYPPLNLWVEVRASPSSEGLSVFYQDLTALKRTEAEQRTRAEREALLHRIGATIRQDPDQILETAVRELGQALEADRCYFAAYDQAADLATAGPEWHREGLPDMAGRYAMSDFGINRDPIYQSGRTQIVTDTTGDSATQVAGLYAMIRVPLVSGRAMTALSVAMARGPRVWTADEVALVEAVATQTQTALEAVQVQRREHRIAEQLQAALQPPLPESLPDLAVAKHYEAALFGEAGVGGDFYDCFCIEKGLTALVVGDLSGKGLAAAAQVSVVRNMLRAFLYSQPTLVEAVNELNRVLAENNLLTGFTTLWVGIYDSATRELHYVNCGQEPALTRRAARTSVEPLEPTGPILGTLENARYREASVVLEPGDAVAIFTDGITEIGPNRMNMLGIEGVTQILRQPYPVEMGLPAAQAAAEHLTQRVIAGVNRAAEGGVMRDDICLLVVVAHDAV